jgi:hypothetical protein
MLGPVEMDGRQFYVVYVDPNLAGKSGLFAVIHVRIVSPPDVTAQLRQRWGFQPSA